MSEEDNWKWQKELLIKRDKEHQKETEMLNYIIDKQDRDIVALSNGNNKLNNIINELEEYIKQFLYMLNGITDRDVYEQCQLDDFAMIMEKLQELKGDSSNEG